MSLPPKDLGWLNRRPGADLFKPLPPVSWLCEALHIAPGAPTLMSGYGFSGKSVFAQYLALCVASGTPLWGKYPVRRGHVMHLDYEAQWDNMARKYQRLAYDIGIKTESFSDYLHPCRPSRTLSSVKDLTACSEGMALIICDAWRGAHIDYKENESGDVRRSLDAMGRASEDTGAVWMPLHHEGKPSPNPAFRADDRTHSRGSGAFYDGAQTVIRLDGTTKYHPVLTVTKTRYPGTPVGPLQLLVEDTHGMDGLRIAIEGDGIQPKKRPGAPKKRDLPAEVLRAIVKQPGRSATELLAELKCNRSALFGELQRLVEARRVRNVSGKYLPYLVPVESSNED